MDLKKSTVAAISAAVLLTAGLVIFPPKSSAKMLLKETIQEKRLTVPADSIWQMDRWVKEGWANAERLFGKKIGSKVEPVKVIVQWTEGRESYERTIGAWAEVPIYPLRGGGEATIAGSSSGILLFFSKEPSPKEIKEVMAYIYLGMRPQAGQVSGEDPQAWRIFSPQSVDLLFSRMVSKGGEPADCTLEQAFIGLAAFLTNKSDPFKFLSMYDKSDLSDMARLVDASAGPGTYSSILGALNHGSGGMEKLLNKLGPKKVADFVAYMKEEFGVNAGSLPLVWNDSNGCFNRLSDFARMNQ